MIATTNCKAQQNGVMLEGHTPENCTMTHRDLANIGARATKCCFQEQEPTSEEAKMLLEFKPLDATENVSINDSPDGKS